MIKINDKIYDNIDIDVYWGNFFVTGINGKRKGKAPVIHFILDNKICIGIETTIPKEWFMEYPLNKEININKFISDLNFEDKDGWYSMIGQKYNCNLIKIDNKKFRINLEIESNELEEEIIKIDKIVEILN